MIPVMLILTGLELNRLITSYIVINVTIYIPETEIIIFLLIGLKDKFNINTLITLDY